MACAQAVQAAVAGCHVSQQAHICQVACSQLSQGCHQLPNASAPTSASHSSSNLNACTGSQQDQSPQQLASGCSSEQSSTEAPANAMPSLNGSKTVHSIHSGQGASRLLAQSAVVSAAAVAASRPGAVAHDMAMPLLECLVKLAMGLPEGRSQEACTVAAAAVVNKWPSGVCNTVYANSIRQQSMQQCRTTVQVPVFATVQTNNMYAKQWSAGPH